MFSPSSLTSCVSNNITSPRCCSVSKCDFPQLTTDLYSITPDPVFFSLVFTEGPEVAFKTAYDVALAANFITGLISVVLAIVGPLILSYVPPAALLVPIAGIGVAFLGLEQVTNSIGAPLVGYPAMLFVFLGWYAGVRLGYGPYRLPEALQVILVGMIMGWSTGLNKTQTVRDAAELVKWYGPDWSASEMFKNFDLIKDYLGIVISIGISATAFTLMCLVSAKNAGDPVRRNVCRNNVLSQLILTTLSG